MKTDYIFEIRKLISENYDPVLSAMDKSEWTEAKTLDMVHKEVVRILPADWVYPSDVYQVLEELGFKSFAWTIEAEYDQNGKEVIPEQKVLAYLMDRKTAAV